MTRPLVTMSTAHFKYLVSQSHALDVNTISVFGHGESLLDKELPAKIRFCAEAQLDTFLTTNAALMGPDESYELLDAGLSHIRFSAHGFGENYNKVHKGLDWAKFIENVGLFIETRKRTNSRCVVSFSVIPMHDESIQSIRQFWERHCDFLEIWRPHDWAGGRDYRGITPKRKRTCGRPASGPVQIQADGKMIVCCWDFNGAMVVGDTNTNTIEEILRSDAFDQIRRKHELWDHSGLLCEHCDQLNDDGLNPLLYSNRDNYQEAGRLSSTKIKLKEK